MVCSPTLFAQDQVYPNFTNYGTSQGLPSPEVYDILQDSKGYMWFATDNGISRFDGYSFKNFDFEDGLDIAAIFRMEEDEDSVIWMAGLYGEIYCFDGDSIRKPAFNSIFEQYRGQHKNLTNLCVDEENIYVGLSLLGIFTINKKTGNYNLINPVDTAAILYQKCDNGQAIVVNTKYKNFGHRDYSKKLESLGKIHGALPVYKLENHKLIEGISIPCFYQADMNNVNSFGNNIIANGNSMLFAFDCYFELQEDTSVLHFTTDRVIRLSQFENPFEIWDYANYKSKQGARLYSSLEDFYDQKGYEEYFADKTISDIYKDQGNGIWFSSIESGVYRKQSFNIQSILLPGSTAKDGLSTIVKLNDEELYILNGGDEFWRASLENRSYVELVSPDAIISVDGKLLYDSLRNILVLDGNRFVQVYENGKWHLINSLNHYRNEFVFFGKNTRYNSKNDIYLTATHVGFFIYDAASFYEKLRVTSFPYKRCHIAFQDTKDRIWIGSTVGLFEYKDSTFLDHRKWHPALSLRIEDIAEFPDGKLAFATKGGGILIKEGDEFTQISLAEGLSSSMIECLFTDDVNEIWVGTLAGLNQLINDSTSTWRVKKNTIQHGLPSNEIYQITRVGRYIVCATGNGIAYFENIPVSAHSPQPFIEALIANGKISKSSEFPFNNNNISLQFLTINYNMNGDIPYKYRLNNGSWQFTKARTVNFANLSPDKYTFQLSSQNEDGIWSSITNYTFQILPPWYQRWWARTIWLVLLLSTIYLFYSYRTNQLKARSKLKEEMFELERSALQAQMNPHFIFNCLNSIQNFISKNEKHEAIQFLARFARMVRANLNASMARSISLEQEIKLLEDYLTLEQHRHADKFIYKIEVEDDIDAFTIIIPPMLIQPFVENAIIHGMKRSNAEGLISVVFALKEKTLLVKIQDNGPGINQNDISAKSYKSVGIQITQKRLSLIEKGIAKVKIHNIDDTAVFPGTEVEIEIPLN